MRDGGVVKKHCSSWGSNSCWCHLSSIYKGTWHGKYLCPHFDWKHDRNGWYSEGCPMDISEASTIIGIAETLSPKAWVIVAQRISDVRKIVDVTVTCQGDFRISKDSWCSWQCPMDFKRCMLNKWVSTLSATCPMDFKTLSTRLYQTRCTSDVFFRLPFKYKKLSSDGRGAERVMFKRLAGD